MDWQLIIASPIKKCHCLFITIQTMTLPQRLIFSLVIQGDLEIVYIPVVSRFSSTINVFFPLLIISSPYKSLLVHSTRQQLKQHKVLLSCISKSDTLREFFLSNIVTLAQTPCSPQLLSPSTQRKLSSMFPKTSKWSHLFLNYCFQMAKLSVAFHPVHNVILCEISCQFPENTTLFSFLFTISVSPQ